jgi:hypothetical protein
MTDYHDTEFKIIMAGAAIVNSAWIVYKTDQVILIEVDLRTKYTRVNASCNHSVFIECTGDSLYTNPDVALEGDTWIEFPEAEGYSFFGASGGRYTLQLTFFKRV